MAPLARDHGNQFRFGADGLLHGSGCFAQLAPRARRATPVVLNPVGLRSVPRSCALLLMITHSLASHPSSSHWISFPHRFPSSYALVSKISFSSHHLLFSLIPCLQCRQWFSHSSQLTRLSKLPDAVSLFLIAGFCSMFSSVAMTVPS